MNAEFIREICLSFPDVTEDIKWGNNLCFLAGGKIFCIMDIEDDFGVSFKVKDEEVDELTARVGIIPAPYLAKYKWVYVNDEGGLSLQEFKHYLRQSYEIILSKQKAKLKKRKSK